MERQNSQPSSLCEIDYCDLEFYERCGGGAFGSVYRAKWKSKNAIVAVKKVLILEKEAHVLSILRHKNIIQFFGAVIKPPNYCLITEFAENGSLYAYLASHQRENMLDLTQVLTWAIDIAEGMNYLHTGAPVKVLHRDLKSKNVVISSNLTCKICDFGASKFLGSTTKMSLAGTLPWMAPEIIQCLPASEFCDVWSYGVVLWELLTHEVPFRGIEGFQVAWLVVEKDERLTIPNTCPEILASLMRQTWLTEPKSRPTFLNILQQLQAFAVLGTLSEISISYLNNRINWKNEIQTTMERLKTMERDLNLRQKELEEWERRLEEKEQNLERQEYIQEMNIHDVNTWSETEVFFWVQQLAFSIDNQDLSQYAKLFLDHNISGRRLLLLTQEDLLQMGIFSIGHLKDLQIEIEKLSIRNKRMLDFPPLEQALPRKEVEPPKCVILILLFGNHVLRGSNEKEHKWKMFVEVDENDNPEALDCIEKIVFRFEDSVQTIEKPPYVMERWQIGITESTVVDCIIQYQTYVKKPKQTTYQHKVQLNRAVHQKKITLRLKQLPLPQKKRSSSAVKYEEKMSDLLKGGAFICDEWPLVSAGPSKHDWSDVVCRRKSSPSPCTINRNYIDNKNSQPFNNSSSPLSLSSKKEKKPKRKNCTINFPKVSFTFTPATSRESSTSSSESSDEDKESPSNTVRQKPEKTVRGRHLHRLPFFKHSMSDSGIQLSPEVQIETKEEETGRLRRKSDPSKNMRDRRASPAQRHYSPVVEEPVATHKPRSHYRNKSGYFKRHSADNLVSKMASLQTDSPEVYVDEREPNLELYPNLENSENGPITENKKETQTTNKCRDKLGFFKGRGFWRGRSRGRARGSKGRGTSRGSLVKHV